MSKDTEILKGLARLEGRLESVQEDIAAIKLEDTKQNQLLAEHIAGVKSNIERIDIEREARKEALDRHEANSAERMRQLEERLKEVELVPNIVKSTAKVVKPLGIIAGALAAITKFFDLW